MHAQAAETLRPRADGRTDSLCPPRGVTQCRILKASSGSSSFPFTLLTAPSESRHSAFLAVLLVFFAEDRNLKHAASLIHVHFAVNTVSKYVSQDEKNLHHMLNQYFFFSSRLHFLKGVKKNTHSSFFFFNLTGIYLLSTFCQVTMEQWSKF